MAELQRHGVWSAKRLAKLAEPPRTKVHWDFVLSEMQWLSNDFKEERCAIPLPPPCGTVSVYRQCISAGRRSD